MHTILTFLVLYWIVIPPCNAQLTDNFSDTNFSNNPAWTGNDTDFIVNPLQQLQLNSSGTSQSYLVVPNLQSLDSCEWQFWIQENFSPSSSNYGRVYLVSDQQNISGPLNGYYLQFGEALSNDQVELFKQTGTVSTSVCRGTSLIANSFSFRIKITRDKLGLWSIFIDPTGGTNYSLETTGTDITFDSTAWFGISCTYTSSNATKFYFDDFYAGPIVGDTLPPAINTVSILSTTQIDVKFSETVTKSSSENMVNYSINNGIGNPISVQRDNTDSSLVHLTLATALANGTTYTLTVSGIADKTGNILSSGSKQFTYFVYTPPNFKDVVINELMADPTPAYTSLPEVEFLEIYNASGNVFDMNGWKISDGTSTGVIPSFVLLPKQYLILCAAADVSLFISYGPVKGLSLWPSLNNTGDIITLQDSASTFIDSVRYSDSWYNDEIKKDGGWTLELVNPYTMCSSSGNWKSSADVNGGTPGQPNSVFDTLDITPPAVSTIAIQDSSAIRVYFSEPLDSSGLALALITVNNGLVIDSVWFSDLAFNSLSISFTSAIDTGVFYNLSISNMHDCAGNIIGSGNSAQFVIGLLPQEGDVVINEIFADPTPKVSLPEYEFAEMYNTTNRLVDLSGCELNGSVFPAGTYCNATGYLIVAGSSVIPDFLIYGNVVGVTGLSLTNAGEELKLTDATGKLLDKVTYSDTWYRDNIKKNGGWTLERINPFTPCNYSNNWIASSDISGGTPGKKNSEFDAAPDSTSPGIANVFVYSSTEIEVVFNEAMEPASLLSGIYSISDNIIVSGISISDTVSFTSVILALGTPLENKKFYTLIVNNVRDCPGNLIVSTIPKQFIKPEQGWAGDLIINEVLFNPRPYGFDFVEVFNRSDKYIDLTGWQMANVEDDSVVNMESITGRQWMIYPGSYAVITEDSANIKKEYPLYAPGTFIQSGLPAYSDDTGGVVLINNLDQLAERFDYSEKMQFALISDPQGVSLERLGSDLSAAERTNWHSAAENAGWATPGYKNSQFILSQAINDPIVVDPEIFSPDNDGYNDVLTIRYKFSGPGYLANITFFDSKGRLIRTLAQNMLLATEGAVSWDGTTDDRQKARIGIYIIWFETFDLQGNVKRYKKTCVVGGKL